MALNLLELQGQRFPNQVGTKDLLTDFSHDLSRFQQNSQVKLEKGRTRYDMYDAMEREVFLAEPLESFPLLSPCCPSLLPCEGPRAVVAFSAAMGACRRGGRWPQACGCRRSVQDLV